MIYFLWGLNWASKAPNRQASTFLRNSSSKKNSSLSSAPQYELLEMSLRTFFLLCVCVCTENQMTAVQFHKVFKSWMKQSVILELSAGPIHCNYFVLSGVLSPYLFSEMIVCGERSKMAKERVLFSSQLLEIMLKGESSTHTHIFSHTSQSASCTAVARSSTCGDSQVLRAYVRCLLGDLVCNFPCAHSQAFELTCVLSFCHNNLPNNIRFLFHKPSGVK